MLGKDREIIRMGSQKTNQCWRINIGPRGGAIAHEQSARGILFTGTAKTENCTQPSISNCSREEDKEDNEGKNAGPELGRQLGENKKWFQLNAEKMKLAPFLF